MTKLYNSCTGLYVHSRSTSSKCPPVPPYEGHAGPPSLADVAKGVLTVLHCFHNSCNLQEVVRGLFVHPCAGEDIRSFAGNARVSGGRAVRVAPRTTARLRGFLEAPRKPVAFFTQHHELLASGLLSPTEYKEMSVKGPARHGLFRRLFGTGLIYPRESETISFL